MLAQSIRRGIQSSADSIEMVKLIIEIDDQLSYELAMLEQHKITEPNTTCGYVLCTKGIGGKFNKWPKVIGGYSPDAGPEGDYLVHHDRSSAECSLMHIDPHVRASIAIFPVVLIAGKTPSDPCPV